jgi:toxin CptA
MNATQSQSAGVAGVFPLGPSRLLAAILLGGLAAVAVVLVFVDLSVGWLALIYLLLLLSLGHEARKALRLGAGSVVNLRVAADDKLTLQLRSGEWRDAEVLGSTYVTAFLSVVNLRVADERRQRHVVLLPDVLPAEDYRRLRVWLRWRAASGRDSTSA